MKTWKIPVVWQETSIIEVVADTLAEAIELAKDKDGVIPVPDDGVFLDGTWQVICADDVEFVRREHNNGQPDYIPGVEFKPVIHAEWLPLDPKDPNCSTYYCTNCKSSTLKGLALYYKFCPECGAEMKGEKK